MGSGEPVKESERWNLLVIYLSEGCTCFDRTRWSRTRLSHFDAYNEPVHLLAIVQQRSYLQRDSTISTLRYLCT